jgi:hypothetical protein
MDDTEGTNTPDENAGAEDAAATDAAEEETGVQQIEIAMPAEGERQLRFRLGPCILKLSPGTGSAWVTGTYTDPTGSVPCDVKVEGAIARIHQTYGGRKVPRVRSGVPVFELQLGTSEPYSLVIDAGANDLRCDLGGLPLTKFDAHVGAGQVRFDFSAPNPQEMKSLGITAGAADVAVMNLANANATEALIQGGAAAFHIDFGGTLARDVAVKVNAGAAGVDLTIPNATAAKIRTSTTLGGVDAGDGFMTKEGKYWSEAAVKGEEPVLGIEAMVALGGLKLRLS